MVKAKFSLIIALLMVLLLSAGCLKEKEVKYPLAKRGETIRINLINELSNQLTLAIYFIPLEYSTAISISKDVIKEYSYSYKIIVNTRTLQEHLSDLKKLCDIKLQKPINYQYLNLRVYCEFSNNKQKVFSFGLTNMTKNMLVNDKVAMNNKLLYEFIIPFLPQSESERYKANLKHIEF